MGLEAVGLEAVGAEATAEGELSETRSRRSQCRKRKRAPTLNKSGLGTDWYRLHSHVTRRPHPRKCRSLRRTPRDSPKAHLRVLVLARMCWSTGGCHQRPETEADRAVVA